MNERDDTHEQTPPGPFVGNALPWAAAPVPPVQTTAGPGAPFGAGGHPQDAPPGAAVSVPRPGEGQPPTPSARSSKKPTREVTHLPPAGAPNWGLVLTGLIFMVIAAGVILNQINGFQVQELRQVGPMLLVAVGVACALIGVVGLVARRSR